MNETATTAVTPIPSLDAQTIGDMTAILYPGDMTSDSIDVVVVVSGWREYFYIENIWFQSIGEDPIRMNGILANTSIHGSSYVAQVEFIPSKEMQPEKFEGEIILQIARHLGSQFVEFKLQLNLELIGRTIFNEMQTASSNGVEVQLESIETVPPNKVVNLYFKNHYLLYRILGT